MEKTKRYLYAKFKIISGEERYAGWFHGMLSGHGIYRVLPENEKTHRDFLECRQVIIELQGWELVGRLVREQGLQGTHYNLKFEQLTEMDKRFLQDLIYSNGIPSPWKRKFPRLITNESTFGVEYPASVIFQRTVGICSARVINFSYHGLLFEFLTSGLSLSEFVNQKIHFNLISNHGTVLMEIEAKVARLYDEMLVPGRMLRAMGVQLVHMSGESDRSYRQIIRSYCETMFKIAEENVQIKIDSET